MSQSKMTAKECLDKLKSLENQMFSRLKDKRDIQKVEFQSYYEELEFINREIRNALAKSDNMVVTEREQKKSGKGSRSTKD